jgi:hypothetical protein
MVIKNHGIGGTDFGYKSTKTVCDIGDACYTDGPLASNLGAVRDPMRRGTRKAMSRRNGIAIDGDFAQSKRKHD